MDTQHGQDRPSGTSNQRPVGGADPDSAQTPAHQASAVGRRYHSALRSLASAGLFAVILTVYELLLDHLPDDWFSFSFLRYLFAFACAVAVGLGVRYLAESALPPAIVESPESTAPPSTVSRLPVGGIRPKVLLDQTIQELALDFRPGERAGAVVSGWSQYLNDPTPPTPIGTSYGLRTMLAHDVRHSDISRSVVIDSLLHLQGDGGGWCASTQRGIPQPEVTAWVLGAMVRAGLRRDEFDKILVRLEELIRDDDEVGASRTTIVSILVSALAEIAPTSPLLPELARKLADGAARNDTTASWGEVLVRGAMDSIPHTARAVIALDRARRALRGTNQLGERVEAGIQWLCKQNAEFTQTDEQIRRRVDSGQVDVLVVGHFTAAWVARALLCGKDPESRSERITSAVDQVLRAQRNGIWTWHDGSKPIWMTYQGSVTIRDYSLGLPLLPDHG
jgi:hypothetical protein